MYILVAHACISYQLYVNTRTHITHTSKGISYTRGSISPSIKLFISVKFPDTVKTKRLQTEGPTSTATFVESLFCVRLHVYVCSINSIDNSPPFSPLSKSDNCSVGEILSYMTPMLE
jgi:hypothetical protein